jgi:hypothetical protein
LIGAPQGYDSVHGLAHAEGPLNYDELVVYSEAAILSYAIVTYEFVKVHASIAAAALEHGESSTSAEDASPVTIASSQLVDSTAATKKPAPESAPLPKLAHQFCAIPNPTQTMGIQSVHSGKFLNISGGKKADGTNVQTWGDKPGGHNDWRLVPHGHNTYGIQSVHSGKFLNVSGGGKANGTNVQTWGDNPGGHNEWALVASHLPATLRTHPGAGRARAPLHRIHHLRGGGQRRRIVAA